MAKPKKQKEELPKVVPPLENTEGGNGPAEQADPEPEKESKAYVVYNKTGNFVREYSTKSSSENKADAEGYAKKTGGTARAK